MLTKTQAIKNFLKASTAKDLAAMYHIGMECQVIVAEDDGERIQGEFKGKNWIGYTNGLQTWKPFRIPRNANSEPEYEDGPIKWDLAAHAQAIGMTGWDWQLRCSRWVAFDFDAIIGHSDKHLAKLTKEELDAVIAAAEKLDYVTIRHSASGHGLHLYVEVDQIPTANHNEHAALARSILGKMSADCDFDFLANVDVCGGNMWVWRRGMQPKSFLLLKQGVMLEDVPINWREHIKVVTRARKRAMPNALRNTAEQTEFDLLIGRMSKLALDDSHKRLITWLKEKEATHYWDADNNMLVTHTHYLAKASEELGFAGIFKTDSPATDLSKQNCYAIPMRGGVWVVRRFSMGCREHESWEQDGRGWTRTYLNKPLDFETASKIFGAVEDRKGNFHFDEAQVAVLALGNLGIDIHIDPKLGTNSTKVKKLKDSNRVAVSIDVDGKDLKTANTHGWLLEGKELTKIYTIRDTSNEDEGKGELYDDVLRYVIDEHGTEVGWFLYNEENNIWLSVQVSSLKMLLKHKGMKAAEADETMGASVARPWIQVVEPFQPEYVGERRWNRNGAKFRYTPTADEEPTPTWDLMLNHLGTELTAPLSENDWCIRNGIATGKDYLSLWIASLLQYPKKPLPYLFFYSEEQNTGKSSFHEALTLLMTKGVVRANACLDPGTPFNGELDGAILCVVEEVELARSIRVYNRLKDWVTSVELGIHAKGMTPYSVRNTTHWVHMANNHTACPVFPGDTRIVVIGVNQFEGEEIPREVLLARMADEAPAFLRKMLDIEIPEQQGRLGIPIIHTHQRQALINQVVSPVATFIAMRCKMELGYAVKSTHFLAAFHEWLADPEEEAAWTNQKVYKELPPIHAKAYAFWDSGLWVPNLRFVDETICYPARAVCPGTKLVIDDRNVLKRETNEAN